MAGVDAKDLGLKAEKARHEARLLEIEKVKQQREQRDREKMEKEQERELMQREEALIEAVELEKKEEEFPSRRRRCARTSACARRARAVDLVARNVDAEVGSGEFDPNVRPLEVFANLTTQELQELRDGPPRARALAAAHPAKRAFWDDFLTVTGAGRRAQRERDAVDRARVRGRDPAEAAAQARDAQGPGAARAGGRGRRRDAAREEPRRARKPRGGGCGHARRPRLRRDGVLAGCAAAHRRGQGARGRSRLRRADARRARSREAARRPASAPPRRNGGRGGDDDEDLLGADFERRRRGARGARRRQRSAAFTEPEDPPAGFTPEGTPDREYSPALVDEAKVPEYVAVVDAAEDAERLRRARAAAERAARSVRGRLGPTPRRTRFGRERGSFRGSFRRRHR